MDGMEAVKLFFFPHVGMIKVICVCVCVWGHLWWAANLSVKAEEYVQIKDRQNTRKRENSL